MEGKAPECLAQAWQLLSCAVVEYVHDECEVFSHLMAFVGRKTLSPRRHVQIFSCNGYSSEWKGAFEADKTKMWSAYNLVLRAKRDV